MLRFKKDNTGTDSDAIVREIAERCASATFSELSGTAEGMSVAQLRGYVRAHAWPQVLAEAQGVETSGRVTRYQANDLAARALERTVHLVIGAYLTAPITAMPAPHIGHRAAA
jgi:hypothetical protein